MAYEFFVLTEEPDIVTVTVNRPEQENFLDRHVVREFVDVLTDLEDRTSPPRVVIVTGAGDQAFIGGVDPADLFGMDAATGHAVSANGQEFCRLLERASFVSIAAVNGRALGGGLETCLACDIALASDTASFSQIEALVGLTPGFGGTWRLQRRVGVQRARWMTYTASFIDAATALEWGLVYQTFPATELMGEALKLARRILTNSARAVDEAKALITIGNESSLADHQGAERRTFGRLLETSDTQHRFEGFLASRRGNATN